MRLWQVEAIKFDAGVIPIGVIRVGDDDKDDNPDDDDEEDDDDDDDDDDKLDDLGSVPFVVELRSARSVVGPLHVTPSMQPALDNKGETMSSLTESAVRCG